MSQALPAADGAMAVMTRRAQTGPAQSAADGLRRHWPEYLIEALGLGLFMLAACGFGTLFEHPDSPLRQAIADPLLRRIPARVIGMGFRPEHVRSPEARTD